MRLPKFSRWGYCTRGSLEKWASGFSAQWTYRTPQNCGPDGRRDPSSFSIIVRKLLGSAM